MDTNWLEDFVSFGKHLSFTKAAQERNITQSAFSRRIMSLEHWVGSDLIDRRTFPAQLSDAGKEFLPIAKQMVQRLHRSRDDIRASASAGADALRFVAPHSLSIHNLVPLLSDLSAHINDLKTHIVTENLHNCFEQLSEQNCDFLMCYKAAGVPIVFDEQAFDCVEIGDDMLIPVSAPDIHETAKGMLPGWANQPLPFLQYARGSFFGSVVENLFSSNQPNLDVKHVSAFSEALKNLCVRGSGIAWLPRSSIDDELKSGKLVAASGAQWWIELKIIIYTNADLHGPKANSAWQYFQNMKPSPHD